MSTSLALMDLMEEISHCLDSNKFVIGLFIDLQKAFDTIDHQLLIKKMERYGIRGIANQWLQSYLSERLQYVHMDLNLSGYRSVTWSPTRFNIGTNIVLNVY